MSIRNTIREVLSSSQSYMTIDEILDALHLTEADKLRIRNNMWSMHHAGELKYNSKGYKITKMGKLKIVKDEKPTARAIAADQARVAKAVAKLEEKEGAPAILRKAKAEAEKAKTLEVEMPKPQVPGASQEITLIFTRIERSRAEALQAIEDGMRALEALKTKIAR